MIEFQEINREFSNLRVSDDEGFLKAKVVEHAKVAWIWYWQFRAFVRLIWPVIALQPIATITAVKKVDVVQFEMLEATLGAIVVNAKGLSVSDVRLPAIHTLCDKLVAKRRLEL